MGHPATRAAIRLGAAVGGMTLVGVLAPAAPASAHVTVDGEAVQGERARLDIRVPTESDTASTTAVEVHFPQDAPIPSVSVGAVPGWSVEVSYRTLDEPVDSGHGGQVTEVVEVISWIADGPDAGIGPGQFAEFPVSLGPLPEVDELALPTLQTYSDGEIVRWIELPQEGIELERPAPVLRLAAPAAEHGASADTADGDATGDRNGEAEGEQGAADSPTGDTASSSSGAATWLAVAGLVAGLGGLALGGIAYARTRTTTTS
jgi:uncharacterized protein YcnI